MRTKILPLLLIAGMTFGGTAFAATTATTTTTTTAVTAPVVKMAAAKAASGTISKISSKGLYVVVGGLKYHVAKGFSFKELKVGQKVAITYTMKGKLHEASAIKAA